MPDTPPLAGAETPAPRRSAVALVDAHVHIHDGFDVSALLNAAYRNFAAQFDAMRRESAAGDGGFDGMLMLTECAGVDRFAHLTHLSLNPDEGLDDWRIAINDEPMSLTVMAPGGRRLLIVAGRQIVTGEKLEILALGLTGLFDDGLPIREVIRRVQRARALCVLPWGFGKWTARRGRIVNELLADKPGDNFFIGDNAGRLGAWPAPAEFRRAGDAGIRMLSGTDPLPWPGRESTVARFGVIIDRGLDRARPFDDLRRCLLVEKRVPRGYGRLERPLPFVRHQVAMQFRKRMG